MTNNNSEEIKNIVAEIKDDTPVVFDPSWKWANTYQSVSFLANGVQKAQQAMFGEVDVNRLKNVLGAIVWFAQKALQNMPE